MNNPKKIKSKAKAKRGQAKLERMQLMQRTRAALTYANARDSDAGIMMAGFLEIFHPDLPEEQKRGLIHDARLKR